MTITQCVPCWREALGRYHSTSAPVQLEDIQIAVAIYDGETVCAEHLGKAVRNEFEE